MGLQIRSTGSEVSVNSHAPLDPTAEMRVGQVRFAFQHGLDPSSFAASWSEQFERVRILARSILESAGRE